ncbi:hypothetical protein NL676_026285 [Syzygium grande]|nr:hypothetical protein NL676_026285 [Syzygium grande]
MVTEKTVDMILRMMNLIHLQSDAQSVPPSIYEKVEQVSEDKHEAFLMKELKEILSREGLSTDPTDKGETCGPSLKSLAAGFVK